MRLLRLVPLMALVGLLAVSCQNEPDLTGPDNAVLTNPLTLGQFVLPEGATLESATLNLYVDVPNGQTICVHRVTNSWDELTVTWNNFGGAFNAAVVNTFVADASGWKTVDITSLVQAWLDGTYPNYGLLIDQQEKVTPRASYFSSEVNALPPFMRICYTDASGTNCEDLMCLDDAFIWEYYPDQNYGTLNRLYTGWQYTTDLEKLSLLLFSIEYVPTEDGCTHTIGYWKNWNGLGPQPDMVTQYLPIWLGNADGQYSVQVTTAVMSYEILSMSWDSQKNGIIKLYAQLLGAKLSIASGADGSAVAGVITDADNFLAAHPWSSWYSLSKTDQKMVNAWMETLDLYNNGYIGPGHCDEEVVY